jgi:hypothetical protein
MRRAVHYSYEHIALPRKIDFGPDAVTLQLFTLRGPNVASSELRFEMRLLTAKVGMRNVAEVRIVDQPFILVNSPSPAPPLLNPVTHSRNAISNRPNAMISYYKKATRLIRP